MRRKAFTLVELLFVIVVIGILATIMYPQFEGFRTRARLKEVENTIELIRAAERYYYFKSSDYYGFSWDGGQAGDDGNNYGNAENNLRITIPQEFCQYRAEVNNASNPHTCDIFVYTPSHQPTTNIYLYNVDTDTGSKNTSHDYSVYLP